MVSTTSAVASAGGFTPATHAGWWIVTGLGLTVLLLGLLTTTPWAAATAARVAARFDHPADGPRRDTAGHAR
ncbi:hypothetical protein [Kitasatospora phosalacinea]|uniref:Uncharacterized protein n=1 Tax=Kitasatospora phosalacinea TaxID=2065 RepID=A0A9W6PKL5_9ACTN|nr:hypothetical protein [Kitasatospora phosalacinea]GLW56581.1 hypothetical protein Kpho01_45920 [Kitasatospora phosalacinea]